MQVSNLLHRLPAITGRKTSIHIWKVKVSRYSAFKDLWRGEVMLRATFENQMCTTLLAWATAPTKALQVTSTPPSLAWETTVQRSPPEKSSIFSRVRLRELLDLILLFMDAEHTSATTRTSHFNPT